MVPITEAWIKDMLKAGEALNTLALRHNVDILTIKCEPEFGYVHIEGSQTNVRGDVITPVFKATQWRDFEPTIKIAPQVAASTTGAENKKE